MLAGIGGVAAFAILSIGFLGLLSVATDTKLYLLAVLVVWVVSTAILGGLV